MSDRDIVRAVKAAIKKATTIKRVPATIVSAGSAVGTTTVRYRDGQTADVLNYRMGSIPNLRVYIGRDPMFPEVLQVLGPRFSYANIGAVFQYFILDHHTNHEWPGHDTVWVQGQQILPLLVLPSTLFTVKILDGWFPVATTYVHVLEQLVDLSASQPTAGALYALLQVDNAGVVTAKIGTEVDAKELLTGGDIPMPDAGKYPLAAVRLYDGQTVITTDVNSPLNDIVDLRFGGYSLAGGAGHDDVTLDADADTLLSLTGQELGLDPQAANTVLAGPLSGADAKPTMRALGGADVPDLYPRKWVKNAAPTVNDDITAGYYKSDSWIDQANGNAYTCINNAAGAAYWLKDESGGGAAIFAVDGRLAVAENVRRFIIPAPTSNSKWYFELKDTGTAGSTICDIHLFNDTYPAGITIFTTQANRPTVAFDDANRWMVATSDITNFVAGDVLTLDLDEVATGAADAVCVGAVGGGGTSFNLIVEEADGLPSVENVGKIVFGNGLAVTDNGGGQVTVHAPIVQVVETQSGDVASGTALMPWDDTIPQNTDTEGWVLTALNTAITPTDANNYLDFDANIAVSPSNANWVFAALFQDAVAGALAVAPPVYVTTATGGGVLRLQYRMTAGTILETTFKIRLGLYAAGTLTVNGQSGARKFGGVLISSLKITEVKA